MFENGAGRPSNNFVLVSHWYFEEASKALVVDGCTINAFATTWGGTINGIPVWWGSCLSLVATAHSGWRKTRTVQRRNCNLFSTRCSSKQAAMLAFHSWASDMRQAKPAEVLGLYATLRNGMTSNKSAGMWVLATSSLRVRVYLSTIRSQLPVGQGGGEGDKVCGSFSPAKAFDRKVKPFIYLRQKTLPHPLPVSYSKNCPTEIFLLQKRPKNFSTLKRFPKSSKRPQNLLVTNTKQFKHISETF